MAVNVVVEVVSPEEAIGEVHPVTQVIEVVSGATTPIQTTSVGQAAVEVVKPGGTVVNAHYGFDFPESPYEGMIFIKLQEA